MKVSINWLRKMVDFDESPEKIAERITFGAFELDGMEKIQRHVNGLVVGKILESSKHPDADKLHVTKVDIGSEILDIVCGAPNCREGLIVPVAKPGIRLGDFTIDSRKLRGVMSNGMILSEREMGLTDNHEGVLEFDESFVVGQKLDGLIEEEDTILDFEITVNRPDALSHIGIAREIAAYLRKPLHLPSFDVKEEGGPANEKVSVEIKDPNQGPRYVARVVEGVTVQQSPLWMRALLHSLGQRPINNIVDITNYLLFEFGHPLHAFDYHLVKEGRIIVRLATDGETITTLDDKERKLSSKDLLITDPEKGIALAGVMGGANSEVGDDTHDILVEAAYFDPPSIRRTAKSLGMFTESSRRFERGTDPSMPPLIAARCAEMIRTYGGGTVLKGAVDAYPNPVEPRRVSVRPSRASMLLGMDISAETAKEALEALQLPVESSGTDQLTVTAPTYRPDLEREVDLIEEIARIVGYGEVPTAAESRVVLDSRQHPLEQLIETTMDVLVGLGFREVVLPGMTSGKDQDAFNGGLKTNIIERPISPDMNVYSASLIPGILRVVEHNLNIGESQLRFAEIAQVGGGSWLDKDGSQHHHLGLALTGDVLLPSYDGSGKPAELPFMKGIIDSIIKGLSLDSSVKYSYDTPGNLAHGVRLEVEDGTTVLVAGLLGSDAASSFGIEVPVFVLEADLEMMVDMSEDSIKRPGAPRGFKSFSRFPANVRDIALIVPKSIQSIELEEAIRKAVGELLVGLELFDLYEGKPLEKDQRSLAYRLTYQAQDKTLSDDDVEPLMKRVIESVQAIEGVRLRT